MGHTGFTAGAAALLATLAAAGVGGASAQRYDPRVYDPVAPAQPSLDTGYRERVEVRLNTLESELRGVTGRVEELSHAVQRLQQRLDKLVQDIDFRLTAIERSLRGQEPASAGASPAGTGKESAVATPQPTTRPADAPVAVGPSAPRDAAAAPAREAPAPAGAARTLPAGPPMEMYERARQLMAQTRYDDAEAAYREFLRRYPDHQLSDNARYWLGETYYVRRRYEDAASAFLDAYQKDVKGAKAPDNLLKLGLSLSALRKEREACVALDKLLREYPSAEAHLLRRAEQERGQLACG